MFATIKSFFGVWPKEHRLGDRRPGSGAEPWVHVRPCPICLEKTGHQEFMTEICLSCGGEMKTLPCDAATRRIFYCGQWRAQMRYRGDDYLREDGRWVVQHREG